MFTTFDVTAYGDIEDVLQEAINLLQDNDPLEARVLLDAFLDTEAADFTDYDDDDQIRGPSAADHEFASTIAQESLDLIGAGLLLDACRRLELFCRPKWQSHEACEEAYAAATAPPPPAFVPQPAFVQATFQI